MLIAMFLRYVIFPSFLLSFFLVWAPYANSPAAHRDLCDGCGRLRGEPVPGGNSETVAGRFETGGEICSLPLATCQSSLMPFILSVGPARASSLGFRATMQCHGPDEARRQAGLRWELREDTLNSYDGDTTTTSRQPRLSELIRCIRAIDDETKMPSLDALELLFAAKIEIREF